MEDGAPVSGVRLWVRGVSTFVASECITGSDGSYELSVTRGLPAPICVVLRDRLPVSVAAPPVSSEELLFDIHIPEGRIAEGIVVEAQTGRVLPEVGIDTVFNERVTSSRSDGRISVRGILGKETLVAKGSGYCDTWIDIDPKDVMDDSPFVVPMLASCRISGKIVDESGRAIANASVVAFGDRLSMSDITRLEQMGVRWDQVGCVFREFRERRAPVKTDARGHFTIVGLLPFNGSTTVWARVEDVPQSAQLDVAVVSLVMPGQSIDVGVRQISVLGEVVGSVNTDHANTDQMRVVLRNTEGHASDHRARLRDGHFRFGSIPPGEYRLAVCAAGLEEARTIVVERGKATYVELDIDSLPQSLVSGVLLYDDGTVAPHARLTLGSSNSEWSLSVTSNASGSFSAHIADDPSGSTTATHDNGFQKFTTEILLGTHDAKVLAGPRLRQRFLRIIDGSGGAFSGQILLFWHRVGDDSSFPWPYVVPQPDERGIVGLKCPERGIVITLSSRADPADSITIDVSRLAISPHQAPTLTLK